MKRISFFVLIILTGAMASCRRAVYECHCHYPDGAYEIYPIDPMKEKDAKEDCEDIKKNTDASECNFIVNP